MIIFYKHRLFITFFFYYNSLVCMWPWYLLCERHGQSPCLLLGFLCQCWSLLCTFLLGLAHGGQGRQECQSLSVLLWHILLFLSLHFLIHLSLLTKEFFFEVSTSKPFLFSPFSVMETVSCSLVSLSLRLEHWLFHYLLWGVIFVGASSEALTTTCCFSQTIFCLLCPALRVAGG